MATFTPKTFVPETFVEESVDSSTAPVQSQPLMVQSPSNLLGKAVNLPEQAVKMFLPRATNVAQQIGYGAGLKQALPQIQQSQNQLYALSKQKIQQAQRETDPVKKRVLLDESKQLDQLAAQGIESTMGQAEADLGIEGGKQLASPVRSAVGLAGETAAALAPMGIASKIPGASQVLGKGAGALSRIGLSAAEGAIRGGVLGATDPQSQAKELLGKALGGAGTGAVIGGALTGGLEAAKGLAGGIKRVGTGLVASQYNVPRGVAVQQRLQDTVGELSDYGFKTLDQVDEVAPKITGRDGILTKITREAVGQADDVALNTKDVTSVLDVAKNIVDDPSIPIGQDQKLINEFSRDLNGLTPGKQIGNAEPFAVFDLAKKYEKKAAELLRYRPERASGGSSSDEALGKAYKLMADELKDRLYTQAGADNAVIDVAKHSGLINELKEISPKLAKLVKKAKSVAEIRSLAAPFVRGGELVKSTQGGQQIATSNLGGQATGLGKLVQNPLNIVAMPLSYGPLNANLGAGVRTSAAPVNAALQSQVVKNAVEVLTRAGILGSR